MENYNFDTEIIQSEKKIIHILSERIKIATSLKDYTITVFKDGLIFEVVNFESCYTIDEYEKYINQKCKEAADLDRFTHVIN